ncbi:MAG: hypothetical protein Q8O29_16210 [Polaromonas sp.]|uniref:DUF883 family protein n=1 Tax=Polaromonas sp. TaxID=1869339 RepID=UPI0027347EAF|nr:hypothetical protein [Polaromonas sp.]MDP2819780.1 hypothetical protein [Polaromonas sp.]
METSNVTPSSESALLRGVSQAGSSLHNTIDKVAEPARSTVDRAATVAHNTVDKLASGASSVAGKVSDQAHRFTDAPLQAVDYSKAYIKDHPLQAVGVALLVGLIFGRLTASRH